MNDEGGELESTSEVPSPALITRTSAEMLNRRGLPRVIEGRPILFVLGPPGVGKTVVARRILGEPRREIAVVCLRTALIEAAGRRGWAEPLRTAPGVLFDDVDYLHGRYGAVNLFGDLLRERAAAGLRTVLCEGPADQSVTLLYGRLDLASRATILLRFPVGRGRRRHVANRCLARGIPYHREAMVYEPWSYAAVEEILDAIPRQSGSM